MWKDRYFVLKGAYLFRYATDRAQRPKGAPINIIGAQIRPVDAAGHDLGTCFEVSTVRKVCVLHAATEAEARTWIRALRRRKALAIKESMGHAPVDRETRATNRFADSEVNARLRREQRETDNLDGELSAMGGGRPW